MRQTRNVSWIISGALLLALAACHKLPKHADDMKRLLPRAADATLTADPLSGQAPLTVTFSLSVPGAVNYAWDFGDGRIATGVATTRHVYTKSGEFSVVVAYTNRGGRGGWTETKITVGGGTPPEGESATNKHCAPGDKWTGPETDGPAAAPKSCFFTAMSATPAPNAPKTVGAADSLSGALAAAQCGDVFKVDPNNSTLSSGEFPLPKLGCDAQHWVIIESAQIDKFPNEETRVSPAWAGVASLPGRPAYAAPAGGASKLMPMITLKGNGKITGCDHVRLIGFEITRETGGTVYNLIEPTGNYCILDRNWIHGTAVDETVRGVATSSSNHFAAINNYFSDFHCRAQGSCSDAQAISGGLNQAENSVQKIANNFLEASGENILYGGGSALAAPTDVQIQGNYMFKPMTWNPARPEYAPTNGKAWVVKNLLELKNARRFWIEGNRLENVWGGFSQVGAAFLITPKNQGGSNGTSVCPTCSVDDIVLRGNYASYMSQTLQIACIQTSNGGWPKSCSNYSFHDLVFDHVQYGPTCYQCGTGAQQLSMGYVSTNPPPAGLQLKNVVVRNVTTIHEQPPATGWQQNKPEYSHPAQILLLMAGPPTPNGSNTPPAENITWINNIAASGASGLYSTGGGADNCASSAASPKLKVETCWKGTSSFAGNVLMYAGYAGNSDWPSGNYFPTSWEAIGFTNLATGDYSLAASSAYKGKGTDGKDPGADVAYVKSVLPK